MDGNFGLRPLPRSSLFWFGLVLDRDRSPYSYSAYYSGSGPSLWPGLDSGRIARKEQFSPRVRSPFDRPSRFPVRVGLSPCC